jgi:hypothetical protein
MILVNHKASSEDTNSHKAYRHFKKIWKQVKIEVIGNGDETEYIMKEQDNTKCLNLYRSDGRKTPAHPKYQAEYWARNKDKYNSKAREKYAENKEEQEDKTEEQKKKENDYQAEYRKKHRDEINKKAREKYAQNKAK